MDSAAVTSSSVAIVMMFSTARLIERGYCRAVATLMSISMRAIAVAVDVSFVSAGRCSTVSWSLWRSGCVDILEPQVSREVGVGEHAGDVPRRPFIVVAKLVAVRAVDFDRALDVHDTRRKHEAVVLELADKWLRCPGVLHQDPDPLHELALEQIGRASCRERG